MKFSHCKICGTGIPAYNVTDTCKKCFNRYKIRDKNGWYVPDHAPK